jgi:rhamnosyltransferase
MDYYRSVLPILVLYKQDLTFSESLKTLNANLLEKGLTMDLFVYDNSPEAQYEQEFTYQNFLVHYKHDPSNAGVSQAYNSGAAYGKNLNKKWVLLLDQDTIFPAGFLGVYEKAVDEHPDVKIFVPILKTQHGDYLSPCRYKHKRGYWLPSITEGFMDVDKYSPVNSGMLIHLDAFFDVGGYNEAVKLDFADFQFIERFAEKFRTFYVVNVVCLQDFSGYEPSLVKLKHRFAFFCEGAKNCIRREAADGFWYLMVVLRRMSGLMWKNKDLSFFGIFIRKYIL